MRGLESFTDADASRTIVRAIRLLAMMTAVAAPFVGWKLGWQSAALLVELPYVNAPSATLQQQTYAFV